MGRVSTCGEGKKQTCWSWRWERPEGLFSISRPQQCGERNLVKKPCPNPQLLMLLWANNASKGTSVPASPISRSGREKGSAAREALAMPPAVPGPTCSPSAHHSSQPHPKAASSARLSRAAAATGPPALLKAADPGGLGDTLGKGPGSCGTWAVGSSPSPGASPQPAPSTPDVMARPRQRAIAGFSCPGYFFRSSMNHLLKIL